MKSTTIFQSGWMSLAIVAVPISLLLASPVKLNGANTCSGSQGQNGVYNATCNNNGPGVVGSSAFIDASKFVNSPPPPSRNFCGVLNFVLNPANGVLPAGVTIIDARGLNFNNTNMTCTASPWAGITNPPPYIANQANLGKFNGNTNCTNNFNNVQCVTTPPIPQNDPGQGYWASPAYWQYVLNGTNYYMLYYSVTTQNTSAAPKTLNGYQLLRTGSSGPIASQTPTVSTTTLFCYHSPTPSVSSNATNPGSGIVWAIENQNSGNPINSNCAGQSFPPAALHAFNATTLAELYGSRSVQTAIGPSTAFSVPTIFQSRVYMGTKMEVDVFGLCSSQQSGCRP